MKKARSIVQRRWTTLFGIALAASAAAQDQSVKRAADGHPDLSGTYDTATLTPLERPDQFGDKLYLTPEEAAAIEKQELALSEELGRPSDPEREAPPVGGDGSPGPYGNVGGYNFLWIDRGTEVFELDGRTADVDHRRPEERAAPSIHAGGRREGRRPPSAL